MSTDPTSEYRRDHGSGRLFTVAALLLLLVVAGAVFTAAYAPLRALALAGGVDDAWSHAYPVLADALAALTVLSLFVARRARWWSRALRALLLIALLVGGAVAGVQHAVRGFGVLPGDAVRGGVAAAPYVALALAVWLFLALLRQAGSGRTAGSRAASGAPEPGLAPRSDVEAGHAPTAELGPVPGVGTQHETVPNGVGGTRPLAVTPPPLAATPPPLALDAPKGATAPERPTLLVDELLPDEESDDPGRADAHTTRPEPRPDLDIFDWDPPAHSLRSGPVPPAED